METRCVSQLSSAQLSCAELNRSSTLRRSSHYEDEDDEQTRRLAALGTDGNGGTIEAKIVSLPKVLN